MTRKAREVLDDCRGALSMLEDEADIQRWRILWAAAVTLIRTVGHVLDKVDGADPRIKRAAGDAFKKWKGSDPQHRIFRDFIEKERNSLLKEYVSEVSTSEEIFFAVTDDSPDFSEGVDHRGSAHASSIGENLYRPLTDGPWQGEDARDVLSEAIIWWEGQLQIIDQAAANEVPNQA